MINNDLKLWIEFPPGRDLAEKLEEMGLDANDLAALPKRAKKITYTTPEADVLDDCMTGLQELCRKIGIRVLFAQKCMQEAGFEA